MSEPASTDQGCSPEGGERWLRIEKVPVTGREAEVAALAAALERAVRGRGGACLLRGEAGVGKTRLAEEALSTLRDALVLRSKATERESPVSYEGVTGLLRSLRRRAGLLTLADGSPRLAPFRPALTALLPEWRSGEPATATPGDRPFLAAAVAELLQDLLSRQPVCVFLDDLQWMDSSSLELLDQAAEQLSGEPLALLMGVRDGEPNPWMDGFLASLRRGWDFSAWHLRRLGREATVRLAERWLGATEGSLEPELAERLYRETAGNPFYLQEVITGLAEQGALQSGAGRADRRAAELPIVTGGMLAQVERRFRGLGQAEQEALEAASVAGERFSTTLLQAVLGSGSEGLEASLEVLVERHFLASEGPPTDGTIAFTHPKVREAVYRSLPADRRLRWHRETARVLGALPLSHPARSIQTIGYHLSLGEAAGEALPVLLEAGDELLKSQAYGEAAWYLGRAGHHLEQLQGGGDEPGLARLEGRLWLLRGHLFFSQGRQAEKNAAFLRAWDCLDLLPPEVDAASRAQAALFRAQVLLNEGAVEQAEAFLRTQRSFVEAALGRVDTMLHLHHMLARIHGERQEWTQRRQVLEDAFARAAAMGSEEHVSELARLMHREALATGDEARAEAMRSMLARRARTGAKPTTVYRAEWLAAAAACRAGEWEEARDAAERMLAIAERNRHAPFCEEARWLQLEVKVLSEPQAALPALRQRAGAAAEPADGRTLSALAAAAAESGAWEEVDAVAQKLLSHAASTVGPDRHGWARQARLVLAEAALHRNEPGEALKWLEEMGPDGTPPGPFWTPAEALALRAWALAAGGSAPGADREVHAPALEEVSKAAAAIPDVRLQAIVRTQLAHAAVAAGDRPRAHALYEAARPVLAACGSAARLRFLAERLCLGASSLPRHRPVPGLAGRRRATERSATAAPEAPRLTVRLLGGFECSVDGREVPSESWGARKARDLFKYLLLRRGRPAPVDEVLEEFWPDLTVDGARRALRSALYRVRRALEPDRPTYARSSLVQVTDDTVRLNAGADADVDVYQFEDRLRQATRREAMVDLALANRIREEALALYTGELLPGDVGESWAHGPREWLREQYLTTLARLAEAALLHKDPAAALDFAERMLESEPTHEVGIRTAVRALVALGRRSEAVRRFDLYARRLERELELSPEPETRALVDQLRRRPGAGASVALS